MSKEPSETEARSTTRSGLPKAIAFVGVLAGLVVLSQFVDIGGYIKSTLDWIEGQGAIGGVLFVLLYVAATALALPGSVLTLGGGAIYGLLIGFALVSLGSTAGATVAFLIARYVARDWIAGKVENNPKFKAIDEGVAEEGWKIVFLTRLSPVIPFNLQNFGYGLTKVKLWQYVVASWIGMMPGTLMFVYFGHAAGSIAEAGAREGGRTPAEWGLLGVGLAATIVVTVYVTKIAKRKLNKEVHIDEADVTV